MSQLEKSAKSKRRAQESAPYPQHKKRHSVHFEMDNGSSQPQQNERGVTWGTVLSPGITIAPRPRLHEDQALDVAMDSGTTDVTERVVVDLTNDSGVEDDVVDLTPIQIPSISSYDIRGNGVNMQFSTHPEMGYGHERPSCCYATVVQQRNALPRLTDSDDEVQVVSIGSAGGVPLSKQPKSKSTSNEIPSEINKNNPVQSRPLIICPVCHDTVEQFEKSGRQLVSTVCGHVFCNVCIRNSISRQHACPTCRRKLTLKQYHPLFL